MQKLPDFTEFLSTITPEMCEQLNSKSECDVDELKTKFDSKGYAAIPEAISQKSFSNAIGLLSWYHKWLSEQLNKD